MLSIVWRIHTIIFFIFVVKNSEATVFGFLNSVSLFERYEINTTKFRITSNNIISILNKSTNIFLSKIGLAYILILRFTFKFFLGPIFFACYANYIKKLLYKLAFCVKGISSRKCRIDGRHHNNSCRYWFNRSA